MDGWMDVGCGMDWMDDGCLMDGCWMMMDHDGS